MRVGIFFLFLLLATDRPAEAQKIPFGFFAAAPVASCAGLALGGGCWYASAANQSCDAACATHGGCNATVIRTYGGSDGTDADCITLGMSFGWSKFKSTDATNAGCYGSASAYRRGTGTTTCAATATTARACACNN